MKSGLVISTVSGTSLGPVRDAGAWFSSWALWCLPTIQGSVPPGRYEQPHPCSVNLRLPECGHAGGPKPCTGTCGVSWAAPEALRLGPGTAHPRPSPWRGTLPDPRFSQTPWAVFFTQVFPHSWRRGDWLREDRRGSDQPDVVGQEKRMLPPTPDRRRSPPERTGPSRGLCSASI